MVLQIKTMSRPLYKNQFEKQLKPVKKIKTNKATKLDIHDISILSPAK